MNSKTSRTKTFFNFSTDLILKEGLVFLTGVFLGTVISLVLTSESATDFWSTVGSMLAGLGTISLLGFGWFKSNEWIQQAHEKKLLDIKLQAIQNINTAISKWNFSVISIDNTTSLNQLHNDFSKTFVIVNSEVKLLKSINWEDAKITSTLLNLNEGFEKLKLNWLASFHILKNREVEVNVGQYISNNELIHYCNDVDDQSRALLNVILSKYK
jgi:hypothetical protein